MTISKAFLALCLPGVLAKSPPPMPNIGYVASGYNIYYGNPLTTEPGVDPGFTQLATGGGQPIYQTNYNGQLSSDQRHAIPDGFSAKYNDGCSLDFKSTSHYSSFDYMEALNAEASFSASGEAGEYGGGAFSASGDYGKFQRLTTSNHMRMVDSVAECSLYTAQRHSYAKPNLTSNFACALKELPEEYGDGELWFNLFDNFGTHTVASAILGSRYGFTSYFDAFRWSNVEKTGKSVKASASYEGEFKAGISGGGGDTKAAQESFNSNMLYYSEISLGVPPVRGGDVVKWSQQVIAEPMPIKYALKTLCEVFKDTDPKKKACYKAQRASEYCTKRLKHRYHADTNCADANQIQCGWDMDCKNGNICVDRKCLAGAMTIKLRKPDLCLEVVQWYTQWLVRLNTCNGSPFQKWTFNKGDGKDYMQIYPEINPNFCLDGGLMTDGQPLSIQPCNGMPHQTWFRDIYAGSIYLSNGVANACVDAGTGIIAGKLLQMWQCNAEPQQLYTVVAATNTATILV